MSKEFVIKHGFISNGDGVVNGNVTLSTGGYIYGDTTNPYLRLNNSTGARLGYTTGFITVGPSFGYSNASGEVFRISHANGNVGIGTTSPDSKLDIVSATSPTITLRNGGGTSPAPTLTFYRQSGVSGYIQYDPSAKNINIQNDYTTADSFGNINFRTRGANARMTIAGAGDVGIGTTSPAYTLDIYKGGNAQVQIYGTNEGQMFFRGNTTYASFSTYGDTFRMGASTGYNSATAQFVLKNNGNVGIGTTSPSYKLQVKGTSAALSDGDQIFSVGNTTGGTQLAFGSLENSYNWIRSYESGAGGRDLVIGTNAENMRITTAGNVGIGTTSPSTALDVGDGQISGVDVLYGDSAGALLLASYDKSTFTSSYMGFYTADGVASGERMRIDSAGRVGIGTTAPAGGQLHIKSSGDEIIRLETSSATGNPYVSFLQSGTRRSFIQHHDTSDSLILASEYGQIIFKTGTLGTELERVRITSAGNVGIGTTAPAQKLHVPDKIRLDATSAAPGSSANLDPDPGNPILGTSADANQNILGDPDEWLLINIGGTDFAIPAYIP